MIWWTAVAAATTFQGADYGGADLVLADGDVLEGTFTNIARFEVPAGTRVGVAQGVPLAVEADEVVVAGHLTANGAGHAAGSSAFGGDPLGQGPGGGDGTELSIAGAGGGAHGGSGGYGDSNGCFGSLSDGLIGGMAYGTAADPTEALMGSGGGAAYNDGGAGGGSITLVASGAVEISGTVSANGQDGRSLNTLLGAPGGGAGGTIVLDGATVSVVGELLATGGAGGDGEGTFAYGYACSDGAGGGGGGGGRIKIYGTVSSVTPPDVKGGGRGSSTSSDNFATKGRTGTVYVDDLVAPGVSMVVTGSPCTGPWSVDLTGTPYSPVDLLTGSAAGADVVGVNSDCAGTPTGLVSPTKRRRVQLDETGSGSAVFNGSASAACDAWLEAIDMYACDTSGALQLL